MLEWLKRRVWKARGRPKRLQGSNPCLSAQKYQSDAVRKCGVYFVSQNNNIYLCEQNNTIMASLSDLIAQQVKSAAGGIEIPSNVKNQVLGGLSDSILGSLTQTATKAGGVDIVKNLLTGKADVASSPVTALAGNLFSKNVLSKLSLGSALGSSLSGLIPGVLGKLSGFLKDQDGDGDVDINDIIVSLTGKKSGGSSLLGAATSILGGFLKKK